MIKKILLGLLALFFIFIGCVWLLFSYVQNHPESVFNAINKAFESVVEGQPYQEELQENLQDIQSVEIRTENVAIETITTDDSTLQILLSGMVPKNETGPFIEKNLEGVRLDLALREPVASQIYQININGEDIQKSTDVSLKAKIMLPKNYRGVLHIQTKRSPVVIKVPNENLYEFDLQSTRGNITNHATQNFDPKITNPDIGKIKVQTISGNISITQE